MRIEIFDVGHGHCAVVTSPNGRRLMLDCGTRSDGDRFWTPSLHFFREGFDLLALLNLDEDHLTDLGPMVEHCRIGTILSNSSIGLREFITLKGDGMGPGAEAYARWLAAPKRLTAGEALDFSPLEVRYFHHNYSPGAVDTTNDLSLVVIIRYGLFSIVFTGDLEVNGWQRMLMDPEFRRQITGTTIFVGSHHGRESGCCTELFELFRPEIVIISDDARQYDSQETDAWYRTRCRGIPVIASPGERRYVMTTRNDGSMRIEVEPNGAWRLQPLPVLDWPCRPLPTLGVAPNPLMRALGL